MDIGLTEKSHPESSSASCTSTPRLRTTAALTACVASQRSIRRSLLSRRLKVRSLRETVHLLCRNQRIHYRMPAAFSRAVMLMFLSASCCRTLPAFLAYSGVQLRARQLRCAAAHPRKRLCGAVGVVHDEMGQSLASRGGGETGIVVDFRIPRELVRYERAYLNGFLAKVCAALLVPYDCSALAIRPPLAPLQP
jgi:hypothetical protein